MSEPLEVSVDEMKKLREDFEINQGALAKKLDIDSTTLSKIENGYRSAPPGFTDEAIRFMREILITDVSNAKGRLSEFEGRLLDIKTSTHSEDSSLDSSLGVLAESVLSEVGR